VATIGKTMRNNARWLCLPARVWAILAMIDHGIPHGSANGTQDHPGSRAVPFGTHALQVCAAKVIRESLPPLAPRLPARWIAKSKPGSVPMCSF
jgi:hypothetical protein